MQRREVMKLVIYGGAAWACRQPAVASLLSTSNPDPILDAHIHLFDPSRPGGVPWPEKSDTVLYQPAMPNRYAAVAAPFGVVGAIAIEASPLASDNDWLLNVATNHPIIVGVVGDLVPGTPSYLGDLDRLRGNALFLGFRYGNLWNRDLSVDLHKSGFVEGLKALAQAGLVFESANPNPALIRTLLDIADRVPDLGIVIDHLPHSQVPNEQRAREEYSSNLRDLARNPHVSVKLSEIPVRINGKLITDPHFYQAGLDAIWDVFGDDRILYGSDWPNSDHVATYAQTFAIVREYVSRKGPAVSAKFFWKNSMAAYKWHRTRPDQPIASL
jgi:L-fucono-1,5-lactonase